MFLNAFQYLPLILLVLIMMMLIFLFQISHRVSQTSTYPTKQYLPLPVCFLTRLMCSECCATHWVLWDLEALLWLYSQPRLPFPPRYRSTCIHLAPLFRYTQWLCRGSHHHLHHLLLYSRAASLSCPLIHCLRLGMCGVLYNLLFFKNMSWLCITVILA